MRAGYALVDELAASPLFGRYCFAFPNASRDAGRMLRVAVQIDQVPSYEALLEQALRDRKPVGDEEWHALCATVPWPRALPAWDHAPIEQWRLDWNPAATPDWPEEYVGGCQIGPQSPISWPQRASRRGVGLWLRVCVAAASAALLAFAASPILLGVPWAAG